MVVTQNIETLGPIWTFSLRGLLTFVASGLDINGCLLSYFEGTANLHHYTSCTLTTLHCSKVSFLQCCLMKIYNKIFTKMWGVYSLLWDTVCSAVKYFTDYISLQSKWLFRITSSKAQQHWCNQWCEFWAGPSVCPPKWKTGGVFRKPVWKCHYFSI